MSGFEPCIGAGLAQRSEVCSLGGSIVTSPTLPSLGSSLASNGSGPKMMVSASLPCYTLHHLGPSKGKVERKSEGIPMILGGRLSGWRKVSSSGVLRPGWALVVGLLLTEPPQQTSMGRWCGSLGGRRNLRSRTRGLASTSLRPKRAKVRLGKGP